MDSLILFRTGSENEQIQGDDLLGEEHEGTAQGPAPEGNRGGQGTHPWSSRGHESRHWLSSGP